jgi:hypothetical protein
MARTRPLNLKPAEDLNDLVTQYRASNVTALIRAADLIVAADAATVFLVGDLDPVVIPRRVLEDLESIANTLASTLDPFVAEAEEPVA